MNIFFIVSVLLLSFIKKGSTRFFKSLLERYNHAENNKKAKSIGGSVGGKETPLMWAARV
jgi:hypothetical protein